MNNPDTDDDYKDWICKEFFSDEDLYGTKRDFESFMMTTEFDDTIIDIYNDEQLKFKDKEKEK